MLKGGWTLNYLKISLEVFTGNPEQFEIRNVSATRSNQGQSAWNVPPPAPLDTGPSPVALANTAAPTPPCFGSQGLSRLPLATDDHLSHALAWCALPFPSPSKGEALTPGTCGECEGLFRPPGKLAKGDALDCRLLFKPSFFIQGRNRLTVPEAV